MATLEIPDALAAALVAKTNEADPARALAALLGTTAKKCANERCGRTFYLQEGRADGTQRRTDAGVRYCSARCAKAKAQREYRARCRARKD